MASTALVERALSAYRGGRFEQALEHARKAEREAPEQALTVGALALTKLQRLDEAAEQLLKLSKLVGLTPRICDKLCDLELRRDRVLSAQSWLNRSPPEPERPERRALRTRIEAQHRRLPSVATELALARGSSNAMLKFELSGLLRAAGAAGDAWRLVQSLPPSNSAPQALDLASLAATAGDFAAAAAGYRHALSLSDGGITLAAASVGFFELGEIDAALELSERAARVGVGLEWRAQLELFGGHLDSARRLAEQRQFGAVLAAIALVEQRFEDVLALVEKLPAKAAETSIVQAEALRRLGHSERAKRLFTEAVGPRPAEIPAVRINTMLLDRDPNRDSRETWRMVAPLVGLPADPYPDDVASGAEEALRLFSGNRSALASYVDDSGRLRRFFAAPSLRHRLAKFQGLLGRFTFEDVMQRFDELLREVGDDPLVFTYRGELKLWWGRYAEAQADCARACELDPRTRWAWLGLAACALFRGGVSEALERLERFSREFTPGPNALVYWGEAYYRTGALQAAERALQEAVATHPDRVGAWVVLAAVAAQRGDRELTKQALQALEQRAAPFVGALRAEHDFGSGEDLSQAHASMEHALVMLRGNRSSGFVTYFTRDGRAHRGCEARSLAVLGAASA